MSNDSSAQGRGFAVVTISSSQSSDIEEGGTIARDALVAAGHRLVHQRSVADDLSSLRYLFREWVDDPRVQVIIAIGGSGLDASDNTPEAFSHLISKHMPGFGEIFRSLAFQQFGITALESRALGAVCHSTLVYVLPGTPQAVALAVNQLIAPQLSASIPSDHLQPRNAPSIRIPVQPPR
ncbi:MAG TPA: molybdopterin-binding protein [Polyangiaceae bacterium]|nr:molybdopterin-binding protein [Polyangiaceae bacterium]